MLIVGRGWCRPMVKLAGARKLAHGDVSDGNRTGIATGTRPVASLGLPCLGSPIIKTKG